MNIRLSFGPLWTSRTKNDFLFLVQTGPAWSEGRFFNFRNKSPHEMGIKTMLVTLVTGIFWKEVRGKCVEVVENLVSFPPHPPHRKTFCCFSAKGPTIELATLDLLSAQKCVLNRWLKVTPAGGPLTANPVQPNGPAVGRARTSPGASSSRQHPRSAASIS